jgi:hypothetical protein
MVLHNAAVTGSLTVNGVDVSSITGSSPTSASFAAQIASLNTATASLNNYTSSNNINISALNAQSASFLAYTSSNDVKVAGLNTFSSSILSYTSSNDANIASIYSTTSSLNSYTSSANTRFAGLDAASGSAITRLNALEVASGSAITRLGALETASGSAINRLNALETASGSAITRLTSLENRTGSYATTGSNTFVGGQYFSSSFNPVGFTTTASLYTDGGLRVTRDAYISGTLYLNNVTVFGTQSVAYISSSQLNIGTNIITVNTDTPSVRFGGLAVYDSGSTGLTGSMLWDSQDNQWIYSNPSGSTYDSAMFLVGPRNSSALGNEAGINCNFLSKGNGMHHMTSSGIFEDGSRTCFYGNSFISSSGAACFQGNTTVGGNLNVGNTSTTSSITITGTSVGGFTAGYIGWGKGSQTTSGIYIESPGTNLEVVTGYNERVALSTGTGLQVYTNDGIGNYSSRMLLDRSGNVCFFNNVCAPVFGFTAAANSCIWADASYTRFVTSNSERLSIDVSGISCFKCQVCAPAFIGGTVSGTTGNFSSCVAALSITGTNSVNTSGGMTIANDITWTNNTGYGLLAQDTVRFLAYTTAGGTSIGYGGAKTIIQGGGGNVGIGITSPCSYASQTLHVNSPSGASTSIKVTNTTTTTGVACGLDILQSNNDTYIYNRSVGHIELGTNNAARLTISNAGIACFACQICAPLLEITAPSTNVYPRVNRTATTNEAGWKLSTGGTDSWYTGLRSADNVGSYHFYSYTTSTSVAQITCQGTVLVGTTNGDVGGSVPGIALANDGRILASICSTGALCYIFMGDRRGTSSEGPVLMLARGGFLKSAIGVLGPADSLNNGGITFSTICGNDAICERMRITSSGRIGFGNTSPCARIETSSGGYILKGGWGLFCTAYTDDGLFSGCAMPNLLSTNGYAGVNTKFGDHSGLILGYQDNGAGLYSPAYGFEVRSTDGRPVTGNVVKAIVMRDTDTGGYPFWINNNGSAYFANCVGIGTSSPAGLLQLQSTTPTLYITSISDNNAIREQAIYFGASNTSTAGYIKYQSYSQDNYMSIATNGQERIRITSAGNVGINCTSPGQLLTVNGISSFKGHQQHPSGQWYKIPFYLEKGNGVGNTDTRCIVVINNNDSFQELHFTIEYGSRLQGVSDQYTQTSLRSYGVNRFNVGTITVNDTYIITGGSGCNINTHAPVTVATVGTCMSVVKVDFSSSLGNSSFVWGEIRIWSIESLAGKISIPNNNY